MELFRHPLRVSTEQDTAVVGLAPSKEQILVLQKALGRAVRKYRHRLGLTQESASERADLHRTYLADVERGARNASIGSIVKVANALEVSVSDLFKAAEGEMATDKASKFPESRSD